MSYLETDRCVLRVRFLGRLMHFAQYLADNNIKIKHTGPSTESSFVNNLPKKSILDILSFPQAGKDHFRQQQRQFTDPLSLRHNAYLDHQRQRDTEDAITAERIRRMQNGEVPGFSMDMSIRRDLESTMKPNQYDFGTFAEHQPMTTPHDSRNEATRNRTGDELVMRLAFLQWASHDTNRQSSALDFDYAQREYNYLRRKLLIMRDVDPQIAKDSEELWRRCHGKGGGIFEVWLDYLVDDILRNRPHHKSGPGVNDYVPGVLRPWEIPIMKYYYQHFGPASS